MNHCRSIILCTQLRGKKLRENIQATFGIKIQGFLDKQEKLMSEVNAWRNTEKARLAGVQQLCDDVLALTLKESAQTPATEPLPTVN